MRNNNDFLFIKNIIIKNSITILLAKEKRSDEDNERLAFFRERDREVDRMIADLNKLIPKGNWDKLPRSSSGRAKIPIGVSNAVLTSFMEKHKTNA